MIVGVSLVKDEAPIIGLTVRHLLEQGVDRLLIADGGSTDGTRDILEEFGRAEVELMDEPPGPFDQSRTMSALAAIAKSQGATWVVPFDADEFHYPTEGGTIASALMQVPDDVRRLYARMYLHTDWDYRHPDPKSLPKVVFRATDGAMIHYGNHDVNDVGGLGIWGVVDLRELQYRSFAHVQAKVERARRLFASNPGMDPMHGSHMRALVELSREDLRRWWQDFKGQPTVFDPVPTTVAPCLQ